jgi:hypothetical protein
MDLKPHLRGRNLKWNWDSIAKYCVENPTTIGELMVHCTESEQIVQQNAGAVLGKIIDLDKKILLPYQAKMMAILKTNPHDAVKRAIMRVYQWLAISEEVEGELFDWVICYLKNPEEAIAVKAFGMTVARRICEKYPELAGELLPYIEILVEEKLSAGILSRGTKEIRKLRDLI